MTDATNNEIRLENAPKRIISLVPSQTELLFDLGLDQKVIGITQFCIHPTQWFQEKTKIGGTKKIKLDRIKNLYPDLILANKEENLREEVEALKQDYPVYTTDVSNLKESIQMIKNIGALTNTSIQAHQIIKTMRKQKAKFNLPTLRKRSLYVIWQDPIMSVGGDTFISSMLQEAGFENCLASKTRYPELTFTEIEALQPEVIFLSSEPYPFRSKHITEWNKKFTGIPVILVDGEMFSWYGSRIQHSFGYFETLNKQVLPIN